MLQNNIPPRLLNEHQAARLLGLSAGTLRKLRCTGYIDGGLPDIPFIKMGRSVRYDVTDLEKWIEEAKSRRPSPLGSFTAL